MVVEKVMQRTGTIGAYLFLTRGCDSDIDPQHHLARRTRTLTWECQEAFDQSPVIVSFIRRSYPAARAVAEMHNASVPLSDLHLVDPQPVSFRTSSRPSPTRSTSP
ncbi:hypothetical protein DICSQDRAFT_169990 [Dichomitus squalens LYAD-421 SS1]|uniref:Uncharacterized protein n=1 Tax=Dichomitus squalens (strain LYAD-421) TaxID=732165 RepID=R7SZF3_DICSQ|nr:uncharacterized protein DICSQDRAFT_169990 [Dichomitus squalens LYAD-421 SS1]EJF61574.1 hypothetical protein DICSQDRAFT_169990 [Dichomitus squalens LYAD-421 SS1]